jgi:hypothetical protein
VQDIGNADKYSVTYNQSEQKRNKYRGLLSEWREKFRKVFRK